MAYLKGGTNGCSVIQPTAITNNRGNTIWAMGIGSQFGDGILNFSTLSLR